MSAAAEVKLLIDESAAKVTHGSQLVHSAGQTMANVVGSVEQVNGLIAEITGATNEQSMGLSQINQTIGQLDSVTQQNSAMVEELSAAVSWLQPQACVTNDAVKVFRLDNRNQFWIGALPTSETLLFVYLTAYIETPWVTTALLAVCEDAKPEAAMAPLLQRRQQ